RGPVDGAAVAAGQQPVDPAEQLQVEVELLVVHRDRGPGEEALDRSRQPEQDAEHPPQHLHAQSLTDHIPTVRRAVAPGPTSTRPWRARPGSGAGTRRTPRAPAAARSRGPRTARSSRSGIPGWPRAPRGPATARTGPGRASAPAAAGTGST